MSEEIAVIGVAMPTDGVEKGIKALDTLASTGSKVEKAMDGIDRAAAKTGKSLATLGQGNGNGLPKLADDVEKVSGRFVDAAGKLREANGQFVKVGESASKASGGIAQFGEASSTATASLGSFKAAIGAIGIGVAVRQFVGMADAVTVLNNQLKLSTGSAAAASTAYESLFEIAQRSRVSFTELGGTYASISRAGEQLGISQQRLLGVTEAISNAVAVSGGSAESSRAALVQLSQGLASGTLRGDELNSVMEQTPRLAKALADGLGVTTGELRKLGEEGKITAQSVIKALESQSDVLKKEVAGSVVTVGQAFTQLSNATTKTVGEFDSASGASKSLASAITAVASGVTSLGSTIKDNESSFKLIFGGLAGVAVVSGAGALARGIASISTAVSALGAVMLANPLTLALLGIGAGVGIGVTALTASTKTADGIKRAIDQLAQENQRSEEAMARAVAGGRQSGADNIAKTIQGRVEAIAKLRAELSKLDSDSAPKVSSPNEDAKNSRLAAESASYKARLAAKKAFDLEYASNDAKAIAEIKAQRAALGDLFTAADEAKIRKKFAGSAPKAVKLDTFLSDEAKAYTKALDDLDKVQLTAGASADKLSKTQEVLRGIQASPSWEAFNFRKKEEVILAASLSQAEEDRVAAIAAVTAAQNAYNNSAKQSADSVAKKLQDLGDETRAYAIATEKNITLAEAIDLVAISRLEEEVVRAKIANNATGEKELEREIELRKELAKELRKRADNTASVDAGKKAAAETLAEWKRGWEETDRLARDVFTTWATDGSNAAQKIGDTLKKALLSAIYEATIKKLILPIYTSVVGGPPGGAASALQAAGGGSFGGLGGSGGLFDGSVFGTGTGFGSAFGAFGSAASANFGATVSSFGSTIGLSIEGGLASIAEGTAASIASGLGSIAGALGPIALGVGLLSSLSSYKVESRGNGLTATIGGASGLPSGSVGRYNEFAQTSSGILSGGNTINRDWSVADQGVADYIAKNVQAITASNRAYGDALGLTSGSIDKFTKSIEINTTGLDAAGQQAAINAELAKFSAEQITATYGEALAGVARDGETTAQTLQRLGTELTGTNSMFADLGYTLFDVSVAGANAASTLVSAFGNLQTAQAQLGSFYQNFYSQDEQQANTYRTVQADLERAGISVTVDQLRSANRGDIRAAVDGLAGNVGTEQGAAQYAAAVRAANTLAGIKPVASAAPAAPVVASVVDKAPNASFDYAVTQATDSVVSAWQEAADAIIATMTDIRSSSLEVGPDSFANIKAQFAIEIAKAGSGDLAALQDLPALAKTLNAAGESNSKNAVDQALLTSYILDSLGRVSGARYADSGLSAPNYTGAAIPSATGPTQVYVPSVYIPPSYSQATSSSTDAGIAEVFKKMEERLEKIEKHTEKLEKMLFNATDGGEDYIKSKAV